MATGLAFNLGIGADPIICPSVFNILVELKCEGFDVGLTNGDIQIMSNEWIVSVDCFRDSDLFSFICNKKIELPSLGKSCLNYHKISLEGKICRRVCKKGSDSIFEKVSANKKFKA